MDAAILHLSGNSLYDALAVCWQPFMLMNPTGGTIAY